MLHSVHILIHQCTIFRMKTLCTCITLGMVANMVAACTEQGSIWGNKMWDYTTVFIIEIAELDGKCISCGGQNALIFCKDCCQPRC